MALRVPKIVPAVLERQRVRAWLDRHAQTAVRVLCAPAGAGKTTSAVLYARRRSTNVAFLALTPGASEAGLIAQIAGSAGCGAARSYAELVEGLAALAPLEIIVDNVDGAAAEARALLGRIYLDVPDGVSFIYLTRSEDAVPLYGGRANGMVDVCDPALLAFDTNEITHFAASLGVEDGLPAAAQLREATHGWAIAVAGACRTAAASGMRLADALPAWRRAHDRALRELLAEARSGVSREIAASFDELLAGRDIFNDETLAACRRAGLFVSESDGRLALNPLFRALPSVTRCTESATRVPPAIVEMFGRFEMSIDGRPIAWTRRRDRQIIAFLATRPNGRATRAEIIAAFWPEADRQLAGQSLRTACSTIRRAIAACVGRANVGRYFIGDYVLQLVLENAVISSREFSKAYELAMAADERRECAAAFAHLRAAELLYRSPFLAGEPPAGWAVPYEERFATMFGEVVACLDRLSSAHWSNEAAAAALRTSAIQQVSA
jgi:hypothetical protein